MQVPEEVVDFGRCVEQLASRDGRVVGEAWKCLEAHLPASDEAMGALLKGLGHANARVRATSAKILDHRADGRCVEALTRAARHDPVPAVRRFALHSLACQKCKEAPLEVDAVAILVEQALSDASRKVRREALFGLSIQAPDERAASALRTILGKEGDPELRSMAHRALRRHDEGYRRQTDEEARARSVARSRAASPDGASST